LAFPLYNFGFVGDAIVSATYSGDSVYSSGGATAPLTITTPTVPLHCSYCAHLRRPSPENAQGLSWQTTFSLTEIVGVPTLVTGFSIDGVSQRWPNIFRRRPSAGGNLDVIGVFYNLPLPSPRSFQSPVPTPPALPGCANSIFNSCLSVPGSTF